MTAENYPLTAEHQLVKAIKNWSRSPYIGDDCALLPGQTLATTDTMVQGRHFDLNQMKLNEVGWKAVAVNLSDIAAMGGRPRQLLINLTLPEDFDVPAVERLYGGMINCAQNYRCRIAGGDLTRGPVLVITVTVLGEVHEAGVLMRSTALDNDVVVVTGDFGASAAGLWLMQHGTSEFPRCRLKQVRPQPRLCESWALVRKCGSRGALMDASDGLADALLQIAKQSQVGMDIALEQIPMHLQTIQAAKLSGLNPLDWALYGGEDYELVGTMPESIWQTWHGAADNPFHMIGRVNSSQSIKLNSQGRYQGDIDQSKIYSV